MTEPAHKSIHSERYERFRKMLIAERERAGFTQTQLAQALDRPQSFVSKYEIGERRIDVEEFLQISEVLQTEASELIRNLVRDSDEN